MGACCESEKNAEPLTKRKQPIQEIGDAGVGDARVGDAGEKPVEEAKGGLLSVFKKKDRTGELTDLKPPKVWMSSDEFEKWENGLPF